mgnify:CR=1 FL=1
MYGQILTNAGYKLWSTTTNDTSCWIKEGKPDINVSNLCGLWGSEDATDDYAFGNNEKDLLSYLNW